MTVRAALRKGWCPGALRPMMAKDGLLVRLRITGGIVSSDLARTLAALAETYGSGILDLSARANLQLRGVTNAKLPGLLDGLRACGLLDADADAEAVRNVLASPMAGFGGSPDVRPLVLELERRLSGDARLHRLPAKFGFVIDDGGVPALADIAADVRFEWREEQRAFAVGLGGTRNDASPAGLCATTEVVTRAAQIAQAFLDHQTERRRPGRMRALLDDIGPQDAMERFGITLDAERGEAPHQTRQHVAGLQIFRDVPTLGLAAPFGRLDATMLRCAAEIADRKGRREMRLTPWRAILVPGVSAPARYQAALARSASPDSNNSVAQAGFIVDASDPRLRVAACVGMEGCERGTTSTFADATALAQHTASLGVGPISLHVSGCAKGCAKPSTSAVTLVGRAGRYDLVRDGRADSEPLWRDLDGSQLSAVIAALASIPS